jgi:hypothetical protein
MYVGTVSVTYWIYWTIFISLMFMFEEIYLVLIFYSILTLQLKRKLIDIHYTMYN